MSQNGEKHLQKIAVGGDTLILHDGRVDELIGDLINVRRQVAAMDEPKCSVKSVQLTIKELMRILRGDLTTEQQRKIAEIEEPMDSIQSCQTALMSVMAVLSGGEVPNPPANE